MVNGNQQTMVETVVVLWSAAHGYVGEVVAAGNGGRWRFTHQRLEILYLVVAPGPGTYNLLGWWRMEIRDASGFYGGGGGGLGHPLMDNYWIWWPVELVDWW